MRGFVAGLRRRRLQPALHAGLAAARLVAAAGRKGGEVGVQQLQAGARHSRHREERHPQRRPQRRHSAQPGLPRQLPRLLLRLNQRRQCGGILHSAAALPHGCSQQAPGKGGKAATGMQGEVGPTSSSDGAQRGASSRREARVQQRGWFRRRRMEAVNSEAAASVAAEKRPTGCRRPPPQPPPPPPGRPW
jgi:hypothetical protein